MNDHVRFIPIRNVAKERMRHVPEPRTIRNLVTLQYIGSQRERVLVDRTETYNPYSDTPAYFVEVRDVVDPTEEPHP